MYLWQCFWFVQLKWLLMSIKYACHLLLWFNRNFLSFTTPYTVFPVGWQLGYQLKQRLKSQTQHSEQTSSFAYLVLSLSFRILIKYCKNMRIAKSNFWGESNHHLCLPREICPVDSTIYNLNNWGQMYGYQQHNAGVHLLPIHVLSSLFKNMINSHLNHPN